MKQPKSLSNDITIRLLKIRNTDPFITTFVAREDSFLDILNELSTSLNIPGLYEVKDDYTAKIITKLNLKKLFIILRD